MVDFPRETIIDVPGVVERYRVTPDTVYRWFKRGLEYARIGGKLYTSLEAIQRFSRQSEPIRQTFSDAESVRAIRELESRFGIRIGKEHKDGRQKEAAAC